MYGFAIFFQIFAVAFLAVGTFFSYRSIDKMVSKNLLASSVFAFIFGIGYLLEMMATTEGEALYALATQYIGLSFVTLFFAIYSTELYNFFKIPGYVWGVIFCFELATFIGVLTSKYHDFYYKERRFVDSGMFPHFDFQGSSWFYGFLMHVLVLMIYSILMFLMYIIKKSRKRYSYLIVMALILGGACIWGSFLNGFGGYEPISAVACICLGVTNLIMMGSKNSSIINKAYAESYKNSSIGQIIVTSDMHFLECNNMAKEIYPAFESYKKGQPVKIEGEGINFDEAGNKLHINDKCYKITYQTLDGLTREREGQIISMTDVTTIETQRTRDEVTGLYNRRAYYDKVNEIMAGAPSRVNVLIADLNSLKFINDNFGHAMGDYVIKSIADCFKKAFTSQSYIFRFGGDEYVVLSLAGEDLWDKMINRLDEAINELNENEQNKISISYGTSFAIAKDGIDIKKLMEEADTEMYHRKKSYYETNHIERRR